MPAYAFLLGLAGLEPIAVPCPYREVDYEHLEAANGCVYTEFLGGVFIRASASQGEVAPVGTLGRPALNYRHQARQCLERARALLSGAGRAAYVALELRMALEGLIYDRAGPYKEDLPSRAMSTWQPRKLLQMLLEIDPSADQSVGVGVGLESSPGVPAEPMQFLGTDRRLSLKEIEHYYDRLGSYLHTPLPSQLEGGRLPDEGKLRKSCEELASTIAAVLDSPIFNVVIGPCAETKCLNCGDLIKRRISREREFRHEFTCSGCKASYVVTPLDDHQVVWSPKKVQLPCPYKDCGKTFFLWEQAIRSGNEVTCPECKRTAVFGLAIATVSRRPKETGVPSSS